MVAVPHLEVVHDYLYPGRQNLVLHLQAVLHSPQRVLVPLYDHVLLVQQGDESLLLSGQDLEQSLCVVLVDFALLLQCKDLVLHTGDSPLYLPDQSLFTGLLRQQVGVELGQAAQNFLKVFGVVAFGFFGFVGGSVLLDLLLRSDGAFALFGYLLDHTGSQLFVLFLDLDFGVGGRSGSAFELPLLQGRDFVLEFDDLVDELLLLLVEFELHLVYVLPDRFLLLLHLLPHDYEVVLHFLNLNHAGYPVSLAVLAFHPVQLHFLLLLLKDALYTLQARRVFPYFFENFGKTDPIAHQHPYKHHYVSN